MAAPAPGRIGGLVRSTLGRSVLAGQGGLSFFIAIGAVNLSNLVFHVVVSRLLGPDSYGALSALLNLLTVLSVPLGAVQAAVTRAAATSEGRPLPVGALVARWSAGTVALAAVLVAAGPGLASFLHLRSALGVDLLAAWILPAAVGSVLQGVLIGRLRFRPVAIALVSGTVFARLGLGVVLVRAGLGVGGAMGATVLAQAISVAVLCWALRDQLRPRRVDGRLLSGWQDSAAAMAALVGLSLFTGIDTVLARHFLPPRLAGWYAAAATAGRIALFLPGAVTTLAFPRLAGTGAAPPGRLLGEALAVVAGLGIGAAAVLGLAPHLAVGLLFGTRFAGAAAAVGTLAAAAAGLGVVGLLTYYHLARRSPLAQVGWVGAACVAVGIAAFHGSPEAVALVVLASTAVVLGVSGFGAWRHAVGAASASGTGRGRAPARPPGARNGEVRSGGDRRRRPTRVLSAAGTVLAAIGITLVASLALISRTALSAPVAGAAWAALFAAVVARSAAMAVQRRSRPSVPSRARPPSGPRGGSSRSDWAAAVGVALVGLIAVQTWFTPGTAIAGGDIPPPNGTAWIAHLFSPWVWTGSSLGSPGALEVQLPWAAVLEGVHLLGGPAVLAQRIWLSLLFAGAGLAALALLRVMGFRPLAAAAGALIYLFNPYVVSVVGANPVYLAAMGLLAAVPAVILACASGRWRRRSSIVALALAAPLLGYAYENPPLVGIVVLAALASPLLAAGLWGRRAALRAAVALAGGLALLGAGSAYWLVPSLAQLGVVATAHLATVGSWAWTEGRATLANGFWLNTAWGWRYPEYYPYAPLYSQFPLAWLRYVLPVAGFGALLAVPARWRGAEAASARSAAVVAAAAVALFLILLSTGTTPPGDLIFDPLYHLPVGWLLREPGRFLMVAGLAYGILFAATVEAIVGSRALRGAAARAGRLGARALPRAAVAVGVVAIVAGPGFPLAMGAVVPSTRPGGLPSSHVRVPAYWTRMAGYLNRPRAPAGHLLVLPADDFYQMPYRWGYYGSDGFIPDMIARPVLDPVGQGYGPAPGSLLAAVDLVQTAILRRDWPMVERLAVALGTPIALVRGDIAYRFPGRDIVAPARLAAALAVDPAARLLHRDGPLSVWRLLPARGMPPLGAPIVTATSPTPDLRMLSLFPLGAAIVRSPPHPGWPSVQALPALARWPIVGGVLRERIRERAGWRYAVSALSPSRAGPALAPRQAAGHLGALVVATEGPRRRRFLTITERVGGSLLADGSFASGPWGRVGDCNDVLGSLAARDLHATVLAGAGPGRQPALRLTATADSACESRPLTWTGGPILVSIWVRHLAGAAPRWCLWESGPNVCAPASPISSATGWHQLRAEVVPPAGTTGVSLFLYADSTAPGQHTVNEYANAQAVSLGVRSPGALLTDGSFASGLWGPVGDCNDRSGPAVSQLRATVLPRRGPGGTAVLRLSARADAACESRRLLWTGGAVVLSLWARHLSGAPPRWCLWESGPDVCASGPLAQATLARGWRHLRVVLQPPLGTGGLALFLYADGTGHGPPTVDEYAKVAAASEMVAPQVVVVANPTRADTVPTSRLRTLDASVSPAWQLRGSATASVADGLRIAWVGPGAGSALVTDTLAVTARRAVWLSELAACMVAGLVLSLMWTARRGAADERPRPRWRRSGKAP